MNPNYLKTIFNFIVGMMCLFASHTFAKNQCLICHETLGDKPSVLFKSDIHYLKGIYCSDCHGGNPKEDNMDKAMDKKAGFIGIPKGDDITKICASCHSSKKKMKNLGSTLQTNQWEMLQTSVHGRLSITGKEHIVQCITCHNAHGILSTRNPASPVFPLNVVKTCSKCHNDATFMKKYNPSLPVDQLEKYRTSLHGILNMKGNSKTAECVSCHGSHDILFTKDVKSKVYATNLPYTCAGCHSNPEYMKEFNIPTDQFEKFSNSVHGIALIQKHDLSAPTCNNCHGNHGAIPPGVESISKVCGTCHNLNADLFSSSPHKKAFDERNLPECETCHGKHEIIAATEKLLGITPEAVCSKCHTEKENVKGYIVARKMRQMIDSLESIERLAKLLVDQAEQKGMEISEAKFKIRDARQARLQVRTMVHSFNEEKFFDIVNKGLDIASIIVNEGRQTLDEYYFRRWGFGIVTLIITIVGISLYLKIKQIESKQNSNRNINTRI